MHSIVRAKQAEVLHLCHKHGVTRLELFGSGASDRFDPGRSDLDFVVEFRTAPPQGYADAYFGLLEDLQLLFGRPVDLVVEGSITNPYFRASVDRTRVLLYAA